MKGHRKELLQATDAIIADLLNRQILDEDDPRYGGFWTGDFHVEPRQSGFFLSTLISGYVTPDSRWYLHPEVEKALRADLAYMAAHQRPDGCFDLTPCNFASPPDTAFMLNAVLSGWWILCRCEVKEVSWLREPVYKLIDTAAAGIAAGGFHTPNHRWAIAACLKCCEKVTGKKAYGDRADEFLREGLDINADGEFAERSAGNYNQVNDDQMIRLYLATGEKRFLEAAARNLEMMTHYIDPDGSVFTNNSTRWDLGMKVYTESYYILFLLVGYLMGREDFGAMAEWIWQDARAHGRMPYAGEITQWLLLFPEMDGYGAESSLKKPFERYARIFPDSDIARIRRGNWSYTLLRGKPNCLYFQHGSFSMYMVIYSNLCDRRNFLADTLEKTEHGYRMTSHAAGWYYLPFPKKPEASDWWQMDNEHCRPKTEGMPLDTVVEVVEQEDGIDVHLTTSGVDQLPLRVELAFLPGGYVRTEHFLQRTKGSECIHALSGTLEAQGPDGETITVGQCFGEHAVMDRMSGAYPLSASHYTVVLSAYTPVERTFSIRADRKDRHL